MTAQTPAHLPKITVRGRALDRQQTEAVVDDAKTELVVAGAGTGKTTTLVGKVKYLVEAKEVPLDRILMISFTNNTVDDLRKAVQEELRCGDASRNVMTIHSLGNMIVDKEAYVADRRARFIKGRLIDLVSDREYYAEQLIEYAKKLTEFPYSGYSMNYEHIAEDSLRETANLLFAHGVPYMYERGNAQNDWKGCVHVADEDGRRVKLGTSVNEVKAVAKNPSGLLSMLREEGFAFDRLGDKELALKLINRWNLRIPNSIGGTISRSKATRVTFDHLIMENEIRNAVDPPLRKSVAGRLDLLHRIYGEYCEQYESNGLVDYEDMIIKATEKLDGGYVPSFRYDHVLVDEYQDVSPILVGLITAMRRRMNFNLFCVGDDWQSIYSFNGGDVSQMYEFGEVWKGWGEPSVHRIETTYRCPKSVAEITNRFVMKNKKQMEKSVKSCRDDKDFRIELLPALYKKDIPEMIGNRLDHLPDNGSIFIIGRTRGDLFAFQFDDRFRYEKNIEKQDLAGTVPMTYRRRVCRLDGTEGAEEMSLKYVTAHSAKGLEADYVFIIADRDGKCFPLTADDDVSALFPRLSEGAELPEERRVFYVAMTRARKRLFIVNHAAKGDSFASDSPFVKEIVSFYPKGFDESTATCAKCGGPMKIKSGENGRFYACAAFPKFCKGSFRPFRGM
ncbi:MAG: UvrD-helicase domain-containing protein [Candidatus Methanoplasma sp.]|jgi:DNA helicase-4|nr:UvrD-helicase domain-containing protein [Candidatus Methanoplasma sp.]